MRRLFRLHGILLLICIAKYELLQSCVCIKLVAEIPLRHIAYSPTERNDEQRKNAARQREKVGIRKKCN